MISVWALQSKRGWLSWISRKQRQLQGNEGILDQFRFQGNCPRTPPLTQHFALSEKQVLTLT